MEMRTVQDMAARLEVLGKVKCAAKATDACLDTALVLVRFQDDAAVAGLLEAAATLRVAARDLEHAACRYAVTVRHADLDIELPE